MAAGERVYGSHRLGLGLATEEGSAAALASYGNAVLHPTGSKTGRHNQNDGWHTFRHTFSTLIKSLGVDAKVVQELLRHASFKTTMDGYTQALEAPKRQAQAALADLIMRTGEVGHA